MKAPLKIASLIALASGLMMSAASVQAAEITNWDYNILNQWVDDAGGPTFKIGANPDNLGELSCGGPGSDATLTDYCIDNASSDIKLDWGTPSGGGDRSALRATRNVAGTDMFTNGPLVAGATLFHDNNVITSAGGALKTTTLSTALDLKSIPDDVLEFSTTLFFDITFTETPNTTPCPPSPTFPGSDTPCPDEFLFVNASDLVQTFIVDDYEYSFFLLFTGTDNAGVEAIPGGFKIYTAENTTSSLFTGIGITSRRIPEPGTIGLLGMGILALGAARRRKHS